MSVDVLAPCAATASRFVSEVTEFPWRSFVFFEDPDGNRWALQQMPVRSGG
jgi:hypothetical protein